MKVNSVCSVLPVLPILLVIFSLAPVRVMAEEKIDPKTVMSLRPIDVHNLHLQQTADVQKLVFDFDAKHTVGTRSFRFGCANPMKLDLGGWEAITRDTTWGIVRGGLDLVSVRNAFAAEMSAAGYPAYQPDLSLFEIHKGSDPDFSVAVTITDLQFAECAGGRRGNLTGHSYIQAKWEVYSQKEQKVVYNKLVQASLITKGDDELEERDFNRKLIRQLSANLLADADFVAIFK